MERLDLEELGYKCLKKVSYEGIQLLQIDKITQQTQKAKQLEKSSHKISCIGKKLQCLIF